MLLSLLSADFSSEDLRAPVLDFSAPTDFFLLLQGLYCSLEKLLPCSHVLLWSDALPTEDMD